MSGQEFGNAENAVQRGADLVADSREKARFGLARRFGFLTRFNGVPHLPDFVAQLFVPVAQPGYVSAHAETIEPTRAPPRQASLH